MTSDYPASGRNGESRLVALVPAAGGGRRFGGAHPKQYADLAGAPLLVRTCERLARSLPQAQLVVVLAPDDERYDREIGLREGISTLRCGGATRAETVKNALVALAESMAPHDWVLVHDAARPCVPATSLARLVAELAADPVGGLLAVPVADTLKREDRDVPARVRNTESRAGLWQAQTPQMFRFGILRSAYTLPGALAATDEAQAVEALAAAGHCAMPWLVTGSTQNVKVTYEADLALAAAILAMQEKTT